MIVKSATFIKSAVKPNQYPPAELPEIAFAGRSNVGKSSLINALVNRKRLVKTSSTPGRTQLINFFDINGLFTFVDLPGYGYAKVPERIKKAWGPMVEAYISTRTTLKCVVLIIDIRRTPDPKDIDMKRWLSQFNIPLITVLTKADKLKKLKQKSQQSLISTTLDLSLDECILFSAKSKLGKKEMWEALEKQIRFGSDNVEIAVDPKEDLFGHA